MLSRIYFAVLVHGLLMASPLQATKAVATPPKSELRVAFSPKRIVNGSACVFTVRSTKKLRTVHGTWLGHALDFAAADNGRTWVSIAAAGLNTAPDRYVLEIQAEPASKGGALNGRMTIPVANAKRKTIVLKELTVAEKFTSPDAETLKRISAEKELKTRVFGDVAAAPWWSGNFGLPLDSTITEEFGVRRVFNGSTKSEHKGVDFRAFAGTELIAANRGKVVLARELFYEGNCVVLDHGQGLLTIYMHMSRLDVHEGDIVESGQTLGLSGATGRVTGPHLHMSALWYGMPVDPLTLIALQLPSRKTAKIQ